eukprot:GHVP01047648.1.p1 GENE.GHVP01047648.1~~GHVP01047648.1.p1  ORF type:complete len:651 (+),score=131.16 GHVP01047648.1:129-2081(+)
MQLDSEKEEKIINILKNDFSREMEILHSSTEYPTFTICLLKLMDLDSEIGNLFLQEPEGILNVIENYIKEAWNVHSIKEGLNDKEDASLRITGVPGIKGMQTNSIPKTVCLDRVVSFTGTVIRAGVPKIQRKWIEYICTKCKSKQKMYADETRYGVIDTAMLCKSIIGGNKCGSTKLEKILEEGAAQPCCDYQELKVQEYIGVAQTGKMPESLTIILKNEFVDKCTAGNTVTVSGLIKARWRKNWKTRNTECEVFLKAYDLIVFSDSSDDLCKNEYESFFLRYHEKNKKTPYRARDFLVGSICPDICGLHYVKLAVLLTLIGGVSQNIDDGTSIRGEGHILIAGDPGTAKSKLLSYAAGLRGRSVLTTGYGSSAAGLTATAVKDGGDWHLEAGALVLSDLGVCCIDEFTSIRPADRTSIHEAMEQQTLSIAKAGIVAKLKTRCSIVAACNLDEGRGGQIASPLLSRFDLILFIEDRFSEDEDHMLADFIFARKKKTKKHYIRQERLRNYISYVRATFQPRIGDIAAEILKKYYQVQRQYGKVTVRMFEGLIRLSQAHARLMFRKNVSVDDAIQAVILMELSTNTKSCINHTFTIHGSSVDEPEKEILELRKVVLGALELEYLIEQIEFEEDIELISASEFESLLSDFDSD